MSKKEDDKLAQYKRIEKIGEGESFQIKSKKCEVKTWKLQRSCNSTCLTKVYKNLQRKDEALWVCFN